MYESARYESTLFQSVLCNINIDRTLILTNAAHTRVNILFGNKSGNKLKTSMESAELVKIKVLSIITFSSRNEILKHICMMISLFACFFNLIFLILANVPFICIYNCLK